jgi:hypothetical protein
MAAKEGFRAKVFVTDVVRASVAPILAGAGFRKAGNLFRRKSPRWCDVISIQMNRFGSAESSSVIMHIGVWWREIERLAAPGRVSGLPKEYECTARAIVGREVAGRQHDWPVDSSTDPSDLGDQLAQAVKGRVLPWLEWAHVLENLLDLRRQEPPITFNDHIVTLHLLGRKQELRDRLRHGYAVYLEDHDIHSDFIRLAKRLGFGRKELERLLKPTAG